MWILHLRKSETFKRFRENRCQSFDKTFFEKHVEHYEGLEPVHGLARNFESVEVVPETVSPLRKLKFFMKVERYMFARLFGRAKLEYRNLPSENKSTSGP